MNKAAIQLAAIGLLSASAASAADIRRPQVSAPPPIAPQATWTGCYVGGGGGYGMFNQPTRFLLDSTTGFGPTTNNAGRGWFGTAQVGCDVQVAPNWVVGAFADYDVANIKGDMLAQAPLWVGEEKLKSTWSAGGRIGWIPFQQQPFLVYVSAGHTEARFGGVDFLAGASGLPSYFAFAKHTYVGRFVGAGYEYGVGWLPGLFWKSEYRFAEFGPDKLSIFESPTGAYTSLEVDLRKYVHTVRSALVWRFSFGGPVIASAADLSRVATIPVKGAATVAVAYNWTGCYLGAGGGYGLFDQETREDQPGILWSDNGGRGWFGTVQVGCDYQVGSNTVIGAFGDHDFSGIQGKMGLIAVATVAGEEKQKSSRAAGGRIGWLPFQERLLIFVSGGYTQTQFDQITFVDANGGPPANLAAARHTYSGWFVGSGYEYGLGLLPGLFWKTEYRFAFYGTERVALTDDAGVPRGDFIESRKYIQTIRSALLWRFNVGGPVVARY